MNELTDLMSEMSTSTTSSSRRSAVALDPMKTQASRAFRAVSVNHTKTRMSSMALKALDELDGPLDSDPEQKFKDINLWALVREMRTHVHVRDRRYHFKVYPMCFVGFEGAQWLIKAGYAENEKDAEVLGTMLVTAGLVYHVCDDHEFRSKYLFYRFAVDEMRTSDPSVSAPLTPYEQTLQ